MKKVFVLIKVNNRDSYKPFCDFVNSIHNLTFQILWDYKFQYYCGIGFDSGHLNILMKLIKKNSLVPFQKIIFLLK